MVCSRICWIYLDDNFIDTLDINILNNFCLTEILNIKNVNSDEELDLLLAVMV